ncbi:thioredoxin family protein [Cytobacillus sp. FJAT-54145]|uniref:Thioredoxin family protein n=1 Tax=Cytobacillus spartinae TaxID=3299023 RepID=A0ABW6KAB3_9BACI
MKKLLLLMSLCFLVLAGCNQEKGGSSYSEVNVKTPSMADVLEQKETEYLVYFWQTNCAYCKEFHPILETYTHSDGALHVYGFNLATEGYSFYTQQLGLQGTPTLFKVKEKDGKREIVLAAVGVLTLEELNEFASLDESKE